MADRIPVFELHIRPLFRMIDRDHMMRGHDPLDLWSLDDVWNARQSILEHIHEGGGMPPKPTGGALHTYRDLQSLTLTGPSRHRRS